MTNKKNIKYSDNGQLQEFTSHAHYSCTKTRTPSLSLEEDQELYKPKTIIQQDNMRIF